MIITPNDLKIFKPSSKLYKDAHKKCLQIYKKYKQEIINHCNTYTLKGKLKGKGHVPRVKLDGTLRVAGIRIHKLLPSFSTKNLHGGKYFEERWYTTQEIWDDFVNYMYNNYCILINIHYGIYLDLNNAKIKDWLVEKVLNGEIAYVPAKSLSSQQLQNS